MRTGGSVAPTVSDEKRFIDRFCAPRHRASRPCPECIASVLGYGTEAIPCMHHITSVFPIVVCLFMGQAACMACSLGDRAYAATLPAGATPAEGGVLACICWMSFSLCRRTTGSALRGDT